MFLLKEQFLQKILLAMIALRSKIKMVSFGEVWLCSQIDEIIQIQTWLKHWQLLITVKCDILGWTILFTDCKVFTLQFQFWIHFWSAVWELLLKIFSWWICLENARNSNTNFGYCHGHLWFNFFLGNFIVAAFCSYLQFSNQG